MKTMLRRSAAFERQRLLSTVVVNNTTTTVAKPFTAIPGPKGPFGIGTLINYLPIIGKYSWLKLHKAGQYKYEKYGAIVRETIIPGEDIVWLYDPNDIAILLNERDYPRRRSHLALEKYRLDRPHIYSSAGLLPTNGAEWWRLRSELQKEISAPKQVRNLLPAVDKVTQEFIASLDVENCFDALPKLARLNLELTCLLTFDVRLNSFSVEEQSHFSRSSRLMHAAQTTNTCVLPTDQGLRLWRLFETPNYKRLRKAQEYMESVAVELVNEKLQNHKSNSLLDDNQQQSSLIDEYLKNPNLTLSDIIGMAADLLLAGVDTTSFTSAFALYYIARNEVIQQKLYEEAAKVLESKMTPLSGDALRTGVPYTRAVLKEVFRLNPISVGVGRILNKDMILSGYNVPKGTVVVTQNMVACRLEKNFPDPLTFKPERWLQRKNALNPYLVLPFGHGMRACIARRFAEQNMLVLLLRLLRNYEIIWKGCDEMMDVQTLLINKPSKPIEILLKRRV